MAEFKHRGYASAYALVRREISKLPSLHTLNKLLELQLLQIPKNEVSDLELIKSLIEKYTNKLGLYFCNNCGFKAANFHWHCPACNAWDTYSPRRFE